MDDTLDALGLLCPLPVLKIRKRLTKLPAGARLQVLTDDPAAIVDIPHFIAETGHVLESQGTEGDGMVWVIRKSA